MGNLRQSMTDEEWNAMGLVMGLVPEEELQEEERHRGLMEGPLVFDKAH